MEPASTGAQPHRSAAYPTEPARIPVFEVSDGDYSARFARSPEDLERVQRLRYEVFNLELG